MGDRYCKYAELIIRGVTNYPLEEHQRDCDTCQSDIKIESLTAEVASTIRQLKELREWLSEGSHHYRVTAYNTVNQIIVRLESTDSELGDSDVEKMIEAADHDEQSTQ